MYSGWAFIDCDGTLIDGNGEARPHIRQLINKIKELNLILVVWSGGGKEYAQLVVRTLERHGYINFNEVDHFMWKGTPIQWSHIRPVWFVDDSPFIIKEHTTDGEKAFYVPFYKHKDKEYDTWLVKAAEDVTEFMKQYNKGGERSIEVWTDPEPFGSNK